MTIRDLSIAIAFALVLLPVGCAEATDQGVEEVASDSDELTSAGKALIGSYVDDTGPFRSLVLTATRAGAHNTFFADVDTGIRCVRAPCPSDARIEGTFTAGSKTVTLYAPGAPAEAQHLLGKYSYLVQGQKLSLFRKDFAQSLAKVPGPCTDKWSQPIALPPGTTAINDLHELTRTSRAGVDYVLQDDHLKGAAGPPLTRVLLEKICTDSTCRCPGKVLVDTGGITVDGQLALGLDRAAVLISSQPVNGPASVSLHRMSLSTGEHLADVPVGKFSPGPCDTYQLQFPASMTVVNGEHDLEVVGRAYRSAVTCGRQQGSLRLVYQDFFGGNAASTAGADIQQYF